MFQFKQFRVDDTRSAMKVGTDAVLLGAWANVEGCNRLLDVGTGTGIISLMAAQRNPEVRITAIDIDGDAAREARYNADMSPWGERIATECVDVRNYEVSSKFDHIISNPPYFVDALLSPNEARSTARHTVTLSFGELIAAAERLLRDGGRLSVVLPAELAPRFRREAYDRLWLTRECDVATREGEAAKRTLMEFLKVGNPVMPTVESLAIHSLDGGYTEGYRRLTEDFYLAF